MSDRVVPSWARWCLILGLLTPGAGYFFAEGGSSALGFFQNAMLQTVQVPFLRGQNPIVCFNESLRNITGGSLGYDVSRSVGCLQPTRVPFRYVLFVCGAMFVLGLYRHINPEEISNKWPTEWRVFNPANVRRKPNESKPALKLESPQEHPIKPEEGGF